MEQAALYDNIIEYFDTTYGRKENRLAAWQLLCEHVGVEAAPSIIKCKKALDAVFINIFDFVAFQKGGPPFKRFPTASALRTYTKTGRVFPLKLAKESPILRSMLIKVFFK
ncbi:hypothetical protein B0A55_01948 [Friedmanniomyces simplex]|uniref:Uncharacterized protein n=1 Tax=Friedmanniomyces simplex TaxID=329884 RepID=A0A4U0XQ27_9PEZI|nr:hypothetical protein B0A55_01948 [Friedmanniomyces simplex]